MDENNVVIDQNTNLLKELRAKKHNIGLLAGFQVDPINYNIYPEIGVMYFYNFKYLGFGFNTDIAFSDSRVNNISQKIAFFLSF